MKISDSNERLLRRGLIVIVLLLVVPAASAHKSAAWAQTQFAAAQRLHAALEARPAQELTRKDYDRVISAYRRLYLESPTSTKADPSVMAVAQLLEEMGRRFDDHEVLKSAIQQYEFLRRQYPGSRARFSALFHIGEIYQDDLHDKARANEVFEEFLRRYPRNQFAGEARKSLSEPVEKASLKTPLRKKSAAEDTKESDQDSDNDTTPKDNAAGPAPVADEGRNGRATRVTGIRYWSGPDFTRVAVDLERGVKLDSQRIDDPDRIFFDLLNTRLDPKLVGQTIDVNDGFLKSIRIAQFKPGRTRVVLEVNDVSDFKASLLENPPRLMVDVRNRPMAKAPETKDAMPPVRTATDKPAPAEVDDSSSAQIAGPQPIPDEDQPSRRTVVTTSNGVKKTVVDADDDAPVTTTVAKLDPPDTKPVAKAPEPVASPGPEKSRGKKGKRKVATSDDPVVREAQPTENGDRSLIRALGLKIGKIVIDPGHGGHDTGTIGPNGLQEKDLVLDVSRRLGKLLTARLGAEVVYTRSDDTYIPLETRTAIANREAADLFVSVHANSSRDPDARGVETYYLNFSSSPDALEVAARENAVSEKSIHELQDLVKKIALKEKIEESHEFATDVERSLHGGLVAKNPGLRDRGVKKAPFIVLIGANMPSILAEVSFLSNPGDERKLKTQEYRQRIAESLYRGIAKYVSGLSGVKVASKVDKGEGQ